MRPRRLVPLAMGSCHPVVPSSETRRHPLLLLLSLLLLGLRRPLPPSMRLRRLVLWGILRFGHLVPLSLGLRCPVLCLPLRWTSHRNPLLSLRYPLGLVSRPMLVYCPRRLLPPWGP